MKLNFFKKSNKNKVMENKTAITAGLNTLNYKALLLKTNDNSVLEWFIDNFGNQNVHLANITKLASEQSRKDLVDFFIDNFSKPLTGTDLHTGYLIEFDDGRITILFKDTVKGDILFGDVAPEKIDLNEDIFTKSWGSHGKIKRITIPKTPQFFLGTKGNLLEKLNKEDFSLVYGPEIPSSKK